MKLHIPRCGDAARLSEDWSFNLVPEKRNAEFYNAFCGAPTGGSRWPKRDASTVLLPSGTELVFDRVYIRQNNDEYASVTFIVKYCMNESLVGERFWVKLDDANRMELEFTGSDNPVGGFPKAKYQALLREQRQPGLADERSNREAMKAAIEAARQHVRALCDQDSELHRSNDQLHCHISSVINAVMQDEPRMRASDVRFRMTCPLPDKSDRYGWRARSASNPDGTVTRDLRFAWNGRKYGGFRLTMRGLDVIACAPLA